MIESSGLEKSGWVLKKAQVMPSWNSRFVIADPEHLQLKYYKERPKNEFEKERGTLKLTDCTVSVDASCNEDEYRFLITTANQKETYHLEVDDDFERQEWIRIIRLISDLGVTKKRLIEEKNLKDNKDTFKQAVQKLLKTLESTSTESRKSLDRIAKQKWKAKIRLIELRDNTQKKHRALRDRQNEMKSKEKTYREELSHLNRALYILQQQVRKSNELQQQVVEIFGTTNDNENNITVLDKAKQATTLCQSLINNNYPKNKQLIQQKSREEKDEESSDYSMPENTIFEKEMISIITSFFPHVDKNYKNDDNINYDDENENIIKIFELYHKYYVEVHAPREMELIKIRTKCEQKYNSLRYVSTKKELARREEEEIEWIMMEMKRAIDRLNREGVPLAPNEEKDNSNFNNNHTSPRDNNVNNDNVKNKSKNKKNKSKNNKNNNDNQNHRNSSDIVPVLAHRGTWSEASDTIFQLNVARQQQYQATRDLEEGLKSREVVRSWYEDRIA